MSERIEREVFVDVASVRLRAVVEDGPRHGDATASESVLVLHGFTGAAASMEGVSEPLARDRRVARLELIGHGGSDAPEALAPYEMAACAEQIVASARSLDLGRPHLLGYSMGGRAALAAALAQPRAFSSLVLVGATAGIADSTLRAERIASDEALAERIERDGIEAFVDAWMALPIFASQSRLGSEALDRARAQRLRNQPHGLAQSLRGMGAGAQAPLHDRLHRFEGPVLLVVGEEDAKFRDISASLEAAMPRARTRIIEGVGHAAHLEAPETFARVVAAFLDEVEIEERDRRVGAAPESSVRREPTRQPAAGGGDPG